MVHRAHRGRPERDQGARLFGSAGRPGRHDGRPERSHGDIRGAGTAAPRDVHGRVEERFDRGRPPRTGVVPVLRWRAPVGCRRRGAGPAAVPVALGAGRPLGHPDRGAGRRGRLELRSAGVAARAARPAGEPGGQARRRGGRLARPAGRLAGHGALGLGLRGPAPPSGREHVREVVVGRPRRTGLVDSDGDRVGSPVAVACRAHPGLLGRAGGRLRALPARFGRPRRTRRLPPAGPGAGPGGGRRGAGHAQPDEPRRGHRGDRDRRGALRPPPPVGVGVLGRSAIPPRAGAAASDEGAAGPGAAGGAVEDDPQVLGGGRAQRRRADRHRHLRGLGAGDRLGRFRDAVRSGADRQDHVGRRAAGPGRREPRLGTPPAVEGRRRGGLAQASRRRRGGAGGGCARRGRRPHEPGAGPSGRLARGHRGPGQPRVPGRRGGRGDRPDDRSGRRRPQRGGRLWRTGGAARLSTRPT